MESKGRIIRGPESIFQRGEFGIGKRRVKTLNSGISVESYQILLYYLYRPIEDSAGYLAEHLELCEALKLRGRILIADEGLNGTVSGQREMTESYMKVLNEDPRTKGIQFKVDPASGHAFPKLSIKRRDEVVTLDLGKDDFSPDETTGEYLTPAQWRDLMRDDNTVLVDARNQYEWELGHFEGALLPPVENFRELPGWVRENRSRLEGKKIMTYCTGGIRCEKFSGFLLREGFSDVCQLDGGIVSYGKEAGIEGEGFAGKCYVFDQRIAVEVNHTAGATVVSRCLHCGVASDRYVNCSWSRCNRQYFCCASCERDQLRFCSSVCEEASILSLAALGIGCD